MSHRQHGVPVRWQDISNLLAFHALRVFVIAVHSCFKPPGNDALQPFTTRFISEVAAQKASASAEHDAVAY
jgi:hypothetical protein